MLLSIKIKFTQVAFVYLQKNNKVLLLQKGGRLAMGLWSLPGGHVDKGENFEEAAIREASEETGYEVSLDKIIYQSIITNTEYKGFSRDTEKVEIVIFRANIIAGKLTKDNQALDLKWFKKEEFIKKSLRWSFLEELILKNLI